MAVASGISVPVGLIVAVAAALSAPVGSAVVVVAAVSVCAVLALVPRLRSTKWTMCEPTRLVPVRVARQTDTHGAAAPPVRYAILVNSLGPVVESANVSRSQVVKVKAFFVCAK
jgi:hypothetical protein